MAGLIGLSRSWFQSRRHFPHYDLSAWKQQQAIARGASWSIGSSWSNSCEGTVTPRARTRHEGQPAQRAFAAGRQEEEPITQSTQKTEKKPMATKTKKPANGPAKATVKAKAKKKTRTAATTGPYVKLTIIATELLDPAGIEPNPWQPRISFDGDDSQALVEEMRAGSQLQNVLVRRISSGPFAFQLLCGERRCRAARLAGVSVRASICECSDRDARLIALHENTHRQDLSAVEIARSYRMMLDAGDAAGPTELAELLDVSRSTVSNRLRLLNLPEAWQQRVIARKITERHARAVLPYLEHHNLMAAFCKAIERRATNEELWCQLQEEYLQQVDADRQELEEVDDQGESPETSVTAATDEKGNADRTDAIDDEGPADPPSKKPASLDRGEEATAKDFASRLWGWKSMFLRHAIASQLRDRASEGELLQVACLALVCWERRQSRIGFIGSLCPSYRDASQEDGVASVNRMRRY